MVSCISEPLLFHFKRSVAEQKVKFSVCLAEVDFSKGDNLIDDEQK